MSLLLVLHQPLRMEQALAFAAARDELEKVILTLGHHGVAVESLPPRTQIVTLDEGGRSTTSPDVYERAVGRAEHWVKGGSNVGAGVSRWVRSSQWRLRQIDRLRRIVEVRGRREAGPAPRALLETMQAIVSARGIDEIVVFDLFDLPAALEVSNLSGVAVKIR